MSRSSKPRNPLFCFRIASDLKQYHVAARLRVSVSQYARIESGHTAPTPEQRKILCAMYLVEPALLDTPKNEKEVAAMSAAMTRIYYRSIHRPPPASTSAATKGGVR